MNQGNQTSLLTTFVVLWNDDFLNQVETKLNLSQKMEATLNYSLPTDRFPRVAIVGFYGAKTAMNLRNYELMISTVENICRDDLKLDLEKITWICLGGTWASHLPCSLWHKWGHSNPAAALAILPYDWQEFKNCTQSPGRKPGASVAEHLDGSHMLMTLRLRESGPVSSTKVQLSQMIDSGCQVMTTRNQTLQLEQVKALADYLIYLPWSMSDRDPRHGWILYSKMECPKRIVQLEDLLSQ